MLTASGPRDPKCCPDTLGEREGLPGPILTQAKPQGAPGAASGLGAGLPGAARREPACSSLEER